MRNLSPKRGRIEDSLEAFIDRFNREYANNRSTIPCRELRDLERFGVPREVLRFLAGELGRLEEEAVVVAFLLTLLSFETSRRIDRQAARIVRRRADTWPEIGNLADEIEGFLGSRP